MSKFVNCLTNEEDPEFKWYNSKRFAKMPTEFSMRRMDKSKVSPF